MLYNFERRKFGLAVGNGVDAVRNATRTADPILLGPGQFERETVDLLVAGAGYDFELRRTYRSAAAFAGPYGPGWDHSYNLRLRRDGDLVLVCLGGNLAEQRFVQHPRFGESDYAYYIPPDGVHGVLVQDGGGSFCMQGPQGAICHYEVTDQPDLHRARRLADRFGNFLDLEYSPDDRLERVRVNSPHRWVVFSYDERGRLAGLADHAGRVVQYAYDDDGLLSSVTGPTPAEGRPPRRERYEYERVGTTSRLARVHDWADRLIVENEYAADPLSPFFGHVIRQADGRGETSFLYELLPRDDGAIPIRDTPHLRVWECRRNGHQVERVLNEFGNELLRREEILDGPRILEVITRQRFDADGQVMARLGPDGVLTQFLFGREHVTEGFEDPDVGAFIGDVSREARLGFGNLLAAVTRGRRFPTGSSLRLKAWREQLPPVKRRDHPDDVITKYTYAQDSQLPVSRSDPRHTLSADPLHVELALAGSRAFDPADPRFLAHHSHLTRHEYGAGPTFELTRIIRPDRTRPSPLDGVAAVQAIVERFPDRDPRGRILRRIDNRGYEWLYEYHPPSAEPAKRAKEGFLRRQLVPHIDWTLGRGFPAILELAHVGLWQTADHCLLSAGQVGDSVRIAVEGSRIRLCQSARPGELAGANAGVEIRVDGVVVPPWDQTAAADYQLSGLGRGRHFVEVNDLTGAPVALGGVRSHVAVDFEVDDLGRVTCRTDARGHASTIALDALGRPLSVTRGPLGNPSVVRYVHDPGDRLVQELAEWRDEAGLAHPLQAVIKRYHHDEAGRMVSSSISSGVGGGERTHRYRYDTEGNLCEVSGPRGDHTYFEYDELNRRIRTVRAACSADASVTTAKFDLGGHLLFETGPRRGVHVNGYRDGTGAWQSGVDTRGRARVKTDPLGNIVVSDFDALDTPLIVRQFQLRADGEHELLSRRSTDYDENGDAIRISQAVFDSPIRTADPVHAPDVEFHLAIAVGAVRESVTEYHLDAEGHALAIRRPDGGLQRQVVDGQGRPYDDVDAEGRRMFRVFDGNGNLERLYTFDPVRDPVTGVETHHDVFCRQNEHDALDREIVRIDPYGNRWRRGYDTLGNLTSSRDPLDNAVRFRHNAFGEEIERIQERTASGLGGGAPLPPLVTRRERDAAGNVVVVVDPAGAITEVAYDTLDRPVRTRFAWPPGDPPELRTYDADGNLVSVDARNGLVRTMTYDAMNRHVETAIDAGRVPPADALGPGTATHTSFRYDAAGEIVRHENDFCRVEIRRDSRGLALAETVTLRNLAGAPGPLDLVRRFDLAGRRSALVYPSGREVSYGYDREGRLSEIRNVLGPADYPGQPGHAAGFDLVRCRYAGPRLVEASLGNGLTLAVAYDGRGYALERQLTRTDGAVAWRSQWLRDEAGHVRIETSRLRHAARTRAFGLDSLYRVVSYADGPTMWFDPLPVLPPRGPVDPHLAPGPALLQAAIGLLEVPAAPAVYEYDETGNRRMTREPGSTPVASVPNALDQYTAVAATPWRYDTNGNLRADGTRVFAYDMNDALHSVADVATGASLARYFRDALGRVVAHVTPAGTTFRVYDESTLLVEISAADRMEYTSDHLSGTVVHAARGGEDYWLTHDGPGSLRVLTDSQGTVVALPTYRPFGAPEDGELALSPLPFGYGGLLYSANLPLWHSSTRTYRPDVGRYLQRDALGIAGESNLYVYAENNPVDRWDPTGTRGRAKRRPFP